MRFRPANISLINRRHYLPQLRLTLSSFEKTDQRTLTGHYISGEGWAVNHQEPRSEAFRLGFVAERTISSRDPHYVFAGTLDFGVGESPTIQGHCSRSVIPSSNQYCKFCQFDAPPGFPILD